MLLLGIPSRADIHLQVIKAPAPKHGQVTRIRHTAVDLFDNIPISFDAVQFNSLVVSSEGLPEELEVTAWAESGGLECIMGLRHCTQPLYGVQFHPEVCNTHLTVCTRAHLFHSPSRRHTAPSCCPTFSPSSAHTTPCRHRGHTLPKIS